MSLKTQRNSQALRFFYLPLWQREFLRLIIQNANKLPVYKDLGWEKKKIEEMCKK